jgi:hypothetical protein
MPAIQSFQKFMLEQTDEPSAEESLQRYAEYKFKYVEVRKEGGREGGRESVCMTERISFSLPKY